MRSAPLLGLLLLVTLAAACGGGSSGSAELAIGEAKIATSSPGAVGVGEQKEEDGIVYGEPRLRPGEVAPAVGLADQRAGCTGTDLVPTAANLRDVRVATLCLLNAERAARKLAPLRSNARLVKAALDHARDMVARKFFAHDAPPARRSTFDQRIRATGYMRSSRSWAIGENLAWGTGTLSTPAAIVEAWMASPSHRANILAPRYRETGIAVVPGVPNGSAGGATYSDEFGVLFR